MWQNTVNTFVERNLFAINLCIPEVKLIQKQSKWSVDKKTYTVFTVTIAWGKVVPNLSLEYKDLNTNSLLLCRGCSC